MPHRKAKIRELIDEFRHRGIGTDEIFVEIAFRLQDEHVFNRVFKETLFSTPPGAMETAQLKEFYDAFQEGVYDEEYENAE